jgi:hypothetical protein
MYTLIGSDLIQNSAVQQNIVFYTSAVLNKNLRTRDDK